MKNESDKLGTDSIKSLFYSMSFPIIFALIVNGLYSVVDAIFVTRALGANAIGGISIVFPFQMIVIAIASLIGTGTASVVARRLGAKDHIGAEKSAACAIAIALILGVLWMSLGLLFIDQLLIIMGVTPALLPYSIEYLVPVLSSVPVVLLSAALSDVIRAEGKMNLVMFAMLLSSLTNMVLDPIAIFVLEWGVLGVALATVFSQLLSLFLVLYFYMSGKTEIKLSIKKIAIERKIAIEIVSLGIPVFINYFGISLIVGLVNLALANAALPNSDYMISAYGLLGRVMMFLFFPFLGMMIAYQTLCSYNFGAKHYSRVKEVSALAVKTSTVYGALLSLVLVLFPHLVLKIFTSDQALIDEGTKIAQYIFIGFISAGVTNLWPMYFQAIGRAKPALFLSSVRVYMLQLPMLLIVPTLFGIQFIWFIFPIADAITVLVSYLVIRVAYKKLDTLISSNDKKVYSS